VPYNVLTGGRGDSTKPATFTGFRTALAAVDGYDGLGIGVFGKLAVIDIDDCAANGAPTSEMAMDIIEIMNAYTEISPSGTGVRIIANAADLVFGKSLYYINNQSIGLEIYIAGFTSKFLTVTGNVIHASGLEERGEQLQAVLDKYMLRPAPLDVSDVDGYSYLTDTEVIRKAMNGRNGAAFAKLWSGDISGYDSASEADMALAGQFAFYCGRDYEQMERLFSQSALGERGKWTEREDYRRRTLCAAIANCKTTYTPDYCKSAVADDFAERCGESFSRHPASLIKPAVEVQSREVP
jgi:putative DNA primase/helicase